jgi:hypothetical protein
MLSQVFRLASSDMKVRFSRQDFLNGAQMDVIPGRQSVVAEIRRNPFSEFSALVCCRPNLYHLGIGNLGLRQLFATLEQVGFAH